MPNMIRRSQKPCQKFGTHPRSGEKKGAAHSSKGGVTTVEYALPIFKTQNLMLSCADSAQDVCSGLCEHSLECKLLKWKAIDILRVDCEDEQQ